MQCLQVSASSRPIMVDFESFPGSKRPEVGPRERAPRSLKVRAWSVEFFWMSTIHIMLSMQPQSLLNIDANW